MVGFSYLLGQGEAAVHLGLQVRGEVVGQPAKVGQGVEVAAEEEEGHQP